MFNPSIPISLKDVATLMLPTTAALLGLVYAALIFWLQGGFAGLEYSASILRPLISANGKVLLDLLVGATAMSLFAVVQSTALESIAFWLFAVVFIIDVMKAAAAQGYIASVFGPGQIPQGISPARQFFRKIRNGGPVVWLRIVLLVGLSIGYPEAITLAAHHVLTLTNKASIVFIVATTAIALVQVRSLLTQAVDARAEIERRQTTDNEQRAWRMDEQQDEWSQEKRGLETRIIAEALQQVRVVPWIRNAKLVEAEGWTSRDLGSEPVLEHEPWVQEHGSLHLDIVVLYLQTDVATRDFIFHWSRVILETLTNSHTAVTQYELSFWRHDGNSGAEKTHFGMMRAGRSDVLQALSMKGLTDKEFVRKMPGRFLAPNVAEY
jgi:hypothetical protein